MEDLKIKCSCRWEPFTEEECAHLKSINAGEQFHDYVRVEGLVLTKQFLTHADDVRNMPLRNTDVFVQTFPRSGTTWTQELVWLVSNNLDFETAKAKPLIERAPCIEHYMLYLKQYGYVGDDEKRKMLQFLSTPVTPYLAKVPEGEARVIKTHLSLSLLPEGTLSTAKVVYVARDPRDVAVSFYHYQKGYKNVLSCDFKTFYYEIFCKDLVGYSPYFNHVISAWENRHHPNFLFIFYEELSKDLKGTVKKVSKFLGKEYTDEQYERLCEHLRFDNFKKNKSGDEGSVMKWLGIWNGDFIRKGVAGGWREHFDAEMTAHAQRWMENNLRDTDLRFPQH